ncbi:MAG: 50S ribosomal protein L11 methyltransferase [Deltaproteobacteria bacterium]|nr:50S ribosomal protein L11 methyltransferase [Deltaproteobacteria bacterium]
MSQAHLGRNWLEVKIQHPAILSEAVSYHLFESGAEAVHQEASSATASILSWAGFRATARLEELRRSLHAFLLQLIDIFELPDLPQAEWALTGMGDWAEKWKEGLEPITIGRQLVIKPSWINFSTKPDQAVVTLDPGLAFGTGRHASTYMCLVAVEEFLAKSHRPDLRILDIGTGSGILALACAVLGQTNILAIDIDPEVIPVAADNISINNMSPCIELRQAEPSTIQGTFDLIMANLTAGDLIGLIPELKRLATTATTLFMSGILADQASTVIQTSAANGFQLVHQRQQEEWVALTMKNP